MMLKLSNSLSKLSPNGRLTELNLTIEADIVVILCYTYTALLTQVRSMCS